MAVTPITIDNLPTLTINALAAYSGSVDGANDLLAIYQNSSTSTVNVSRNTFLALSSAPVGLTDSQTLTNKTLTSPTINGATLSGTLSGTYTIGGTPTFPSSVVTLTGTQALTNKTLTSPTINSPTITNASITADAITGYTTSNSGTIYGMSVSTGVLASAALANAVNTASIQSGAITYTKLLSTIFSGQLSIQTNSGSAGGTIYSVNLGGIKLLWCSGAASSQGGAGQYGPYSINYPTGFFSSVQFTLPGVTVNAGGAYAFFPANGSTSGINIDVITTAASTFNPWLLVIGS
jgi:hypothetical protein